MKFILFIMLISLVGCASTLPPETPASKEEVKKEETKEEEEGAFRKYIRERFISLRNKIQEMIDSPTFDSSKFLELEKRVRIFETLEEYKNVLGDNIMIMIVDLKAKWEELKMKWEV